MSNYLEEGRISKKVFWTSLGVRKITAERLRRVKKAKYGGDAPGFDAFFVFLLPELEARFLKEGEASVAVS